MNNSNTTVDIGKLIVTATILFNYGFLAALITLMVLSRLHTIEQTLVNLTMKLLKVDHQSTESEQQTPNAETNHETLKQEPPRKKRWLSMSTF